MNGPILIVGAKGQLGHELSAEARRQSSPVVAVGRDDLDITCVEAVRRRVDETRPCAIVNCAAYTAVDKAESDSHAAHAINALGPEYLARAAAEHDIPLMHVSTDYVFDGTKSGAYTEHDRVAPLGVYGRSKEEGERRVRDSNSKHIILRTSWVYGPYGNNFLKTMLRLLRERDELRVVADQRGCPTATIDIARALLAAVSTTAGRHAKWGTYHFAGAGAATWHGFAEEIVDAAARCGGRSVPVIPITTKDYPTPAKRPGNSELDSSRFYASFGYKSPSWQKRTREVVESLLVTAEAR
ncbi:MAG: dTDP-4-dehydrorhamnose reductase [Methylobacteriaceae bacterium]|nr:dTDP-4-dehydrorhamnose reductase [Methylobacteriaceae bacterium]